MKKVVLITGASSGIGKVTAAALATEGFIVYAAARRLDRMEDLKQKGIHVIYVDVTDDQSIQAVVKEIIDKENRIDILVNNAGYGSFGALEDVPLMEAKQQYDVNVFGPARLIQLVLPFMRRQRSGRIINVSSMGGKFGEPHGSWYHSSKYALEGLSDSLRMEVKQFGIEVIVIQPGTIKSEWSNIATENLLKVSGQGAYLESATKHVKMLSKAYRFASSAHVIAQTIVKASVDKSPKTRYTAGGGAKILLFLRRILPDKTFDRLVLSQLK